MSVIREKAQGFTKQIVGQMIGDELLVKEGEEQGRNAAAHAKAAEHAEAEPAHRSGSHAAPKREEH